MEFLNARVPISNAGDKLGTTCETLPISVEPEVPQIYTLTDCMAKNISENMVIYVHLYIFHCIIYKCICKHGRYHLKGKYSILDQHVFTPCGGSR